MSNDQNNRCYPIYLWPPCFDFSLWENSWILQQVLWLRYSIKMHLTITYSTQNSMSFIWRHSTKEVKALTCRTAHISGVFICGKACVCIALPSFQTHPGFTTQKRNIYCIYWPLIRAPTGTGGTEMLIGFVFRIQIHHINNKGIILTCDSPVTTSNGSNNARWESAKAQRENRELFLTGLIMRCNYLPWESQLIMHGLQPRERVHRTLRVVRRGMLIVIVLKDCTNYRKACFSIGNVP